MILKTKKHSGLTLLETMIASSIILVIVGLLMAALLRPRAQQKILEATQTLQALSSGFTKLKHDMNSERVFGKDENGLKIAALFDSGELLKELAPKHPQFGTFTPLFNSTGTTYMEFKQHQFRNGQLLDPWGQPYRYLVCAQESNGWPYEVELVYSAGPDGVAQNKDDLVCEFSRLPVPASKDDPTKPSIDLQSLKDTVGWGVKPLEWP